MKIFTIVIIGLTGLVSCSKNNDITNLIDTKWKVYSVSVLALGNDACAYNTKPSDLFGTPVYTTCQMDDTYNFCNANELIINYGTLKCNQSEPTDSTFFYEKRGDSLIINDQNYGIIMFTNDTLILDYCTTTNIEPATPGKIGIKLIRKD